MNIYSSFATIDTSGWTYPDVVEGHVSVDKFYSNMEIHNGEITTHMSSFETNQGSYELPLVSHVKVSNVPSLL